MYITIINSLDTMAESNKGAYGKRPLWQWILIYAVIGGIVYGLIYYFVLAKKGNYDYGAGGQNQQYNIDRK